MLLSGHGCSVEVRPSWPEPIGQRGDPSPQMGQLETLLWESGIGTRKDPYQRNAFEQNYKTQEL